MKKLLLILLILSFSFAVHAWDYRDSIKGVIAAKNSSSIITYVYSGGVDDFYDVGNSFSGILGDEIILSSNQTITTISLKISDKQTATNCWIGLYDSAYNLITHGHYVPQNGWNDVAINYLAVAGTYRVCGQCDAAIKIMHDADGIGSAPRYVIIGWTIEPPLPFIEGSPEIGVNYGFRLGY